MGFFDKLFPETESYGYKTFKNTDGWDNEKMLERLSEYENEYGVPKMGWIRAFGKERQVIVYNLAHETNYVYIDAQPKKIVVSMAPKPGQIGGAIDHVDAEDVTEQTSDTLSATLGTMESVDVVIKLVGDLIKNK